MKTIVTFFLPGLFNAYLKEAGPTESLARLVSRATPNPASCSIEQSLKSYFQGLEGNELPTGALGALTHGYTQVDSSEFWCVASPVECLVDQKTAYVLGNAHLHLTSSEVLSLIEQLNPFLEQDGISLKGENPREWYCQLTKQFDIASNDFLEVIRKNLAPLLPSGPDKDYWHRLITECQMLLQTSKVNEARALQNKPLVSSLWFWGFGKLPQKITSFFDAVYSNWTEARGLALCANKPIHDLPSEMTNSLINEIQHKKTLFADNRFYDYGKHQHFELWNQLLADYEKNWFKPLLSSLTKGEIDELHLSCANGKDYVLTKSNIKYFWRSIRPISAFI